MTSYHHCSGESCKTCKKRPKGSLPVVKDCWYDVPYPCLEGFLRILTLLIMLFILCVIIHLAVGQVSNIKPFTSFLERAHLITDASELGLLKGKPSKEEGLYSPHQEDKEDGDLKDMPSLPYLKNASKLQDLPMDIYKGTDDENAYFITFRETCNEQADGNTEATQAQKHKLDHRDQDVLGLENSVNQHKIQYGSDSDSLKRASSLQIRTENTQDGVFDNVDQKMRMGTYLRPNTHRKSVQETPSETISHSMPEQHVRDLVSFEKYMRMREGPNKKSSNLGIAALNTPKSHQPQNIISEEHRGLERNPNINQQPGPIPNLKILLSDHPKPVLDMKIDMNNLNSNRGFKNNQEAGEADGVSVEDEEMSAVSAEEAKNFLKEKIAKQIQDKEEEVMDRMDNRPKLKLGMNVMEVEGNSKFNSSRLSCRKPRAVENIDKSITYTEHERTMKQEVEVTYKRAQDIAKAILKTSEAAANSLDLCKKPISTNFISDEPLTEAEDVIDQIIGQLKESLELTMGCRTCVKPHKDLMLFMRWLIYDDVSVKLCPSKPKAADLRKNYLLFNHDNAFLGRVCGAGEYPRAPMNCSVAGEPKGRSDDGSVQSKIHSKSMLKKNRNITNGNTNNRS